MHRRNLFKLVLGLTLCSAACSGDDDSDGGGAAGGTAGSSAGGSGPRAGNTAKAGTGGAGGAASTGTATEGKECTKTSECASGLTCVNSGIPLGPDKLVVGQVCARACTTVDQCTADEVCETITGQSADRHCWSAVTEALKPCGPADTSLCDPPLDCIFASVEGNLPVGVCVNYCKAPNSENPDKTVVLDTCPAGLECLASGEAEADTDAGAGTISVGICGKGAARGQPCDPGSGTICAAATDLCLGMSDTTNDALCYQDCTTTPKCDDGKVCTAIPMDPDKTSYCK
jgi:hypothetical protein